MTFSNTKPPEFIPGPPPPPFGVGSGSLQNSQFMAPMTGSYINQKVIDIQPGLNTNRDIRY
jgi:hypothetical protein